MKRKNSVGLSSEEGKRARLAVSQNEPAIAPPLSGEDLMAQFLLTFPEKADLFDVLFVSCPEQQGGQRKDPSRALVLWPSFPSKLSPSSPGLSL